MIITPWSEFKRVPDEVQLLDGKCRESSTWDRGVWKNLFDNLPLRVILRYREDKLLGFLVMSQVHDEAELLRICVAESNRKEGLGTQLIKSAIHILNSQPVVSFHLEVRKDNRPAIKLYQSMGFKSVGVRRAYYSDPTCDAHIYTLELTTDEG